MKVMKASERPTRRAPDSAFSGTVWQDPIIEAPEPARLRSNVVSFEPGARTAWHTHPLGQTLYVISGVGRIQKEGEAVQEIRGGDTIWIPPHEKHWHGAAPDHGMVHISMQEALDGTAVNWMEKVSDQDYNKKVG